jgi:hypothetical protein
MTHVTISLTIERHPEHLRLRHITISPDLAFPAGERLRFFIRQDEMPRVLYDLDTPLEAGVGFAAPGDVRLPVNGYTLEVNMAATINLRYV